MEREGLEFSQHREPAPVAKEVDEIIAVIDHSDNVWIALGSDRAYGLTRIILGYLPSLHMDRHRQRHESNHCTNLDTGNNSTH